MSSSKNLLRAFKHKRWMEFIQDRDATMLLPELSILPGRSASTRLDHYKKEYVGTPDGCHVKVITKNSEPEAFVWQTTPDKLAQAVRWGVIHTESITSKVISALGHYRVDAHEIIAKGMISNTHTTKMALLDLYQDRFEIMQSLESLVNQPNSQEDIQAALKKYIHQLEDIKQSIKSRFSQTVINKLAPKALKQLDEDMDADIRRAMKLQTVLRRKNNTEAVNDARGFYSMQEFVKTQMLMNLYDLQGINQDISFSTKRRFALTRGRLNDSIEDARKAINDHKPDLVNRISEKHHGRFIEKDKVIYDFSESHLTPEQERKAMLAVSFIEGWDKVQWTEAGKPLLHGKNNDSVPLIEIAATKWRVSRNLRAFGRKVGITLFNMLKSFVISTRPWEEDSWAYSQEGKEFHLVANELHDRSRLNKPIWHTPFTMLKRFGLGFVDIFRGIVDSGKKVIKLPVTIISDWLSTRTLPSVEDVMDRATVAIEEICNNEDKQLQAQLNYVLEANPSLMKADFHRKEVGEHLRGATLAVQDYHLVPGETNDILNSLVRGFSEFTEYFTHDIFAKNPVAGLCFIATYGVAGATIVFPNFASSILSAKFVALQNQMAYKLGSSKMAATVSIASIEAQLMAFASDGLMHGPASWLGSIGYEFAKNPARLATYAFIAYGTGYLLAEGILGYRLPFIGDVLHDEANGSSTNYIILGAKSILLTEALFHKNKLYKFTDSNITLTGEELLERHQALYEQHKPLIERFAFVKWLSDNHRKLPKLSLELRNQLDRHIEAIFTADEAASLRKLIYKERSRSIAYQLLVIPLSYIPAVLRIVFSVLVATVALIAGHPEPFRPMKQSVLALGRQIVKDVSRVLIFVAELSRVVVNLAASAFKMFAFLGSMLVSRIGSIFNLQSGHGAHRFFAHAHAVLRKVGEVLYPTTAAKASVAAHPKSTVNAYENSYRKILKNIGASKQAPVVVKDPLEDDIIAALNDVPARGIKEELISTTGSIAVKEPVRQAFSL